MMIHCRLEKAGEKPGMRQLFFSRKPAHGFPAMARHFSRSAELSALKLYYFYCLVPSLLLR